MNTFPSVQKMAQAAADNIQGFQAYAEIILNASQELASLNIEATRTACSYVTVNAVPAIGEDMREQLAARMDGQGRSLEQAAEYIRSVNDLCIKTQTEIGELNTRRLHEMTEKMQGVLDAFAKTGPTGSLDMISAMKTAMSNASAAYENFVRTSRDVTETNLAAASNALQPMMAAASKASRKAA